MTMFSAVFSAVSISAQQDLFEVLAPSGNSVCIHGLYLSQVTAVGDANEKDLQILVKRGQTTTGSGGSTVTPVDIGCTAASFGGTVKANNTTKATSGTISTLHSEGWNIRGTYPLLATPETRLWIPAGVRATIELATTPASAYVTSGTLYLESV